MAKKPFSIFNKTSVEIMQLFYTLHQNNPDYVMRLPPMSVSLIIHRSVINVQIALKELRKYECVRKMRGHPQYYVTKDSLHKYNSLIKVVNPNFKMDVIR